MDWIVHKSRGLDGKLKLRSTCGLERLLRKGTLGLSLFHSLPPPRPSPASGGDGGGGGVRDRAAVVSTARTRTTMARTAQEGAVLGSSNDGEARPSSRSSRGRTVPLPSDQVVISFDFKCECLLELSAIFPFLIVNPKPRTDSTGIRFHRQTAMCEETNTQAISEMKSWSL